MLTHLSANSHAHAPPPCGFFLPTPSIINQEPQLLVSHQLRQPRHISAQRQRCECKRTRWGRSQNRQQQILQIYFITYCLNQRTDCMWWTDRVYPQDWDFLKNSTVWISNSLLYRGQESEFSGNYMKLFCKSVKLNNCKIGILILKR